MALCSRQLPVHDNSLAIPGRAMTAGEQDTLVRKMPHGQCRPISAEEPPTGSAQSTEELTFESRLVADHQLPPAQKVDNAFIRQQVIRRAIFPFKGRRCRSLQA
jgi:hypothetical protein